MYCLLQGPTPRPLFLFFSFFFFLFPKWPRNKDRVFKQRKITQPQTMMEFPGPQKKPTLNEACDWWLCACMQEGSDTSPFSPAIFQGPKWHYNWLLGIFSGNWCLNVQWSKATSQKDRHESLTELHDSNLLKSRPFTAFCLLGYDEQRMRYSIAKRRSKPLRLIYPWRSFVRQMGPICPGEHLNRGDLDFFCLSGYVPVLPSPLPSRYTSQDSHNLKTLKQMVYIPGKDLRVASFLKKPVVKSRRARIDSMYNIGVLLLWENKLFFVHCLCFSLVMNQVLSAERQIESG